jgi:hypothetical protein
MTPEGQKYQRRYLRAPFKTEVLFVDDDFVFKADSLNISEGGLLLDKVGHFPEDQNISFMIDLPEFPLFKNFTLDQFHNFTKENLDNNSVRFRAKLVRQIAMEQDRNGVFSSRVGVMINKITPMEQEYISHYVEVFASNLIYLQVLIDSINSDRNNIGKIRVVSKHLGYASGVKISYLRKLVEHDYKSLQWL